MFSCSTRLRVLLHSACPIGSKKTKIKSASSPRENESLVIWSLVMELISTKKHTKPFDWFVDIERIFHITIDQAGCINESHQAKFLLLRSRDLGIEVIHHTCKDVLKRRKKTLNQLHNSFTIKNMQNNIEQKDVSAPDSERSNTRKYIKAAS